MKNRKIAKLLSFKRRFLSRIRRKNSIVDDRLEGNQNRGGIYSILLTRILKGCACHSRLLRFGGEAFVIRPADRVYFIYKRGSAAFGVAYSTHVTCNTARTKPWMEMRAVESRVHVYHTHKKKNYLR